MIVTVLVIIVIFLCYFTIAVWSRNYWAGRFCATTDSLRSKHTAPFASSSIVNITVHANHLNSFNHCFWKLRFWAPAVTYGNEKPEGGDQQPNNTFRRSALVRGTPTKLPISFSLLHTWLADSEHELVSFLSLLQKSISLDELLFRLRYTTTNLSISSHSSDYHGTSKSNYRRNNSNRNALRNTCSFYVIACMKRFLSNVIMTNESQRLYRKATFSEGFL